MESKNNVETFIQKQPHWKKALLTFRKILLQTELEETIKWGMPVYTLNGKNVVGMGAFKSYVGLWFFQGAFIKDSAQLLINAQEGKTKAMRQMRFNSLDEIDGELIKAYVHEAIQYQKAGKELKPDLKKLLLIPEELQSAFDKDSDLKSSFEQFTPGKQRNFAEYISEAKRLKTKQKRLEKIIPMIHQGLAMDDIYRK